MALTVALTGASGFIGGALAAHFCRHGHHVRALLRSPKQANALQNIGVETEIGRLDQVEDLTQLVDRCDIVIHCAGAIRGLKKDDFLGPNVQTVSQLVRICRSLLPLPRFILISSLAAREPDLSPYAWSKHQGEAKLKGEAGGLPWVIFRPPAVYGPKDTSLLPLFQLMRHGVGIQITPNTSRFSLIHVDDLARAILEWVEKGGPSGNIYELDDGFSGGHTWNDVFCSSPWPIRVTIRLPSFFWGLIASLNESCSKIFGYSPMITKGKVAELLHPDWVCRMPKDDPSFQWKPRISLETGLRQLFTSASL